MIDVSTALLAVLPLFFIAIPQPEPGPASETAHEKVSIWQDFRAGLRYMISWPGLLLVAIIGMIINLVLNPAFTLMPILVTQHFEGGAFQLAWIESIAGVGIIVGGLILSIWGGFRRRIVTTMVGLFVIGLGCVFLGLLPASAYPLAIAATFVIGFGIPITDGPLLAVLQDVVEPDMQGRVFTLFGSLVKAMTPLGLIIAGPLADTFGVQTWFIVGGLVTGFMGIAGFFIPAVLNIENNHNIDEQPQAESSVLAVNPVEVD
jgi:DHA3 family macrolide efflux protein-like MFS transporter